LVLIYYTEFHKRKAAGKVTKRNRESNRKGPTLAQQDALDSKVNKAANLSAAGSMISA
jgi:hypothetical protein